jgi:hypothetical protein
VVGAAVAVGAGVLVGAGVAVGADSPEQAARSTSDKIAMKTTTILFISSPSLNFGSDYQLP